MPTTVCATGNRTLAGLLVHRHFGTECYRITNTPQTVLLIHGTATTTSSILFQELTISDVLFRILDLLEISVIIHI